VLHDGRYERQDPRCERQVRRSCCTAGGRGHRADGTTDRNPSRAARRAAKLHLGRSEQQETRRKQQDALARCCPTRQVPSRARRSTASPAKSLLPHTVRPPRPPSLFSRAPFDRPARRVSSPRRPFDRPARPVSSPPTKSLPRQPSLRSTTLSTRRPNRSTAFATPSLPARGRRRHPPDDSARRCQARPDPLRSSLR
jgi:hypothetical protein